MKPQQARSDEHDNNRAFGWGIGAAITVAVVAVIVAIVLFSH